MKHYVVDFESYFDKAQGISASLMGNENYYESSYAYCVSIRGEDTRWVGTIEEAKQKFPEGWWQDPQHQFWAAHSNFDQGWAERYFTRSARPWKCILDRGAASQLPHNVPGLARVVLGRQMDKSTRDWMEGKHFSELTSEERTRVLDYCMTDADEEWEILQKLPEPTPTEDALAEHTRAINRRGIHIDQERLETDKTNLALARHAAFCAIPWHNVAKPLSYEALVRHCNEKGLPVPRCLDKKDEEVNDLLDVHPGLAEVVGHMRRFRRTNTVLKKIASLEARLTPAGILPLEMMYCGARHTRRWSSRGVNIQNLDREPFWLDPEAENRFRAAGDDARMDDFIGSFVWSRHWLVPPPGKLFLSLDYSQIEPRCLNWLAGNDALLALIRGGYGVYEAYAKIAKGWKGEKGCLKKEIGVAAYTLVKNEFLGLGYGMGPAKYESYAGVDAVTAARTVKAFRAANKKTVKLWNTLDSTIKLSARNREELVVELPSGDFLRHFGVRANRHGGYESWTTKGDFSHTSHQSSLWGGTLTENVTQRFARDVLGEAILRLEKAGFVVAFSAHDELILAVDRDNAEDARREAEHLMTQAPDWAPDLPLTVEGGFSDRYSK